MKDNLQNMKDVIEGWTVEKIERAQDLEPGYTFSLRKNYLTKTVDVFIGCMGGLYIANQKDTTSKEEVWIDIDEMIQDIMLYKSKYLNENDLCANDDDPSIIETFDGKFVAKYEITSCDNPKKLLLGFKALPAQKTWYMKISDVKKSKSKYKELLPMPEGRRIFIEIVTKYGYLSDRYPKEWKVKYPGLFNDSI